MKDCLGYIHQRDQICRFRLDCYAVLIKNIDFGRLKAGKVAAVRYSSLTMGLRMQYRGLITPPHSIISTSYQHPAIKFLASVFAMIQRTTLVCDPSGIH
jgi:hypothetical protein